MRVELGSNLRSPVNAVQLNRDLIVVGATGPETISILTPLL